MPATTKPVTNRMPQAREREEAERNRETIVRIKAPPERWRKLERNARGRRSAFVITWRPLAIRAGRRFPETARRLFVERQGRRCPSQDRAVFGRSRPSPASPHHGPRGISRRAWSPARPRRAMRSGAGPPRRWVPDWGVAGE